MRISIDVLNEPIHLRGDKITVLCIENKGYYRKIINALYSEHPEEQNIIFSKDYEPLKFKNNVKFITDFYRLEFNSSFYKKLYDQISMFCMTEIPEETLEIRKSILDYLDIVIQNYDFDFQSNDDMILSDLFKIMNLKPIFNKDDMIEALLEFIIIHQKYAPVKLFVLLNLHNDFTENEIELLYTELLIRKIPVLVLESNTNFNKNKLESITVIDKDLCVIIENE